MAIDAAYAAKCEQQAARARARRERYEQRTGRKRHDMNDTRPNGHESLRLKDYPFIAWDGEAPTDTGYSLFGSSEGHEICRPGLTTEECFDLLLDAKEEFPKSIFIIFGSRYDWDEITRQSMPVDRQARLKWYGHVYWHGYTIKEVEGKFFQIKKGARSVTIYETIGWFLKPYVAALKDYGIGTADEIALLEHEKNRRSEFTWSEIGQIREYMRLELKLMPQLMDKIRSICVDAGFSPRAWYGPSALGMEALRKHKVYDAMAKCPAAVNRAAQYAYAGGRFETFRGGILGETWTYDMNGAYMHAALSDCPNLARGQWRQGREFEPGKFGMYHITYVEKGPLDCTKPYPLFRRMKNGNVLWGRRVDGWYWAPEAELVADDSCATFHEAW